MCGRSAYYDYGAQRQAEVKTVKQAVAKAVKDEDAVAAQLAAKEAAKLNVELDELGADLAQQLSALLVTPTAKRLKTGGPA